MSPPTSRVTKNGRSSSSCTVRVTEGWTESARLRWGSVPRSAAPLLVSGYRRPAQAPADSVWRGSVLDAALAALERSVKEFRGDRKRLYLTGLSMGAYGSWTLALTHPGMFAAIVAVCGGRAAATAFHTKGSGPRGRGRDPGPLYGVSRGRPQLVGSGVLRPAALAVVVRTAAAPEVIRASSHE